MPERFTPRRLAEMGVEPFRKNIGGGIMHPSGVTIIHGAGGVGKGMIAAWTARQLGDEGIPTLVVDFEGHPQEWVRRTRLPEPISPIVWYQDFPYGTIDDLVRDTDILEWVPSANIQAVILDSASRAQPDLTKGQSDAESVRKTHKLLHGLGVPVLVIAHVPKRKGGEDVSPVHVTAPVGSQVWVTQSRLVWSAIPANPVRAGQYAVEIKCVKVNDRDRPPTLWFDVTNTSDRLSIIERRMVEVPLTISERILAIVAGSLEPLTAAQILGLLVEQVPEYHADKTLRQRVMNVNSQLVRLVQRGTIINDAGRFSLRQA